MDLRCESCGADNPVSNRFCGQCGIRLQPAAGAISAPLWPRSASQQPDTRPDLAAAKLPPPINFDNPPPGLVGQFDQHPEPESELHNQLQQAGEIHSDVHAPPDPDTEPARNDLGLPSNSHEAAAADVPAGVAAGARDLQHDDHPSNRTGVSGPSFRGLTDDYPPRYYDDEPEPPSHLRRNLALAITAIVIFLAALQWRSMRDYGLAYVRNGSMTVPTRKLPTNSPAIAADNTTRDPARDPASPFQPAPGAPQPVDSSPNRGNPAYEPSAATTQAAAADLANQPHPLRRAGNTPPAPASAAAAPASRPASMSAPSTANAGFANNVASTPPTRSTGSLTSSPTSNPAGNPSPASASLKPRPFRTAAAEPGSDEMRRAAAAADALSRATWLWRAVGKGNPQAPVELARMYEEGSGVTRNCDQAQLLLRAAAARGNQQAKLSLRDMRIRGGCSPH